MRLKIFFVPIILFFLVLAGCTQEKKTGSNSSSTTHLDHEDPDGFYTCPMHPQVHEHKKGKCPICHMNLVKVSGEKKNMKPSATMEVSDGLSVTNQQLKLAGISKFTVTKKNLNFRVSASGRLISPREVVFQVYESDLQIVKAGLEFSGSPASNPDEVLSGQIRNVDNIVDPSSRTIRVLGVLNKSPSRIVIDGGFHGEIKSIAKDQFAIPEEAVLHTGKTDLVYLISEKKGLTPAVIRLGKKADKEYQVLSGLNEGDVISTGPNFLIDSESKIRGTFELAPGETKSSSPTCPEGQHWDIPMSMCMPGQARK